MQKIPFAYPPFFIYQHYNHDLARLPFCTKNRATSSVHTSLLHSIFLSLKYLYSTKMVIIQIIYT
ncbi:hypothetical protein [Prevotella intermedia]|uniref:hypothetical protein n=1 Tax=Prevotella intermedia TaxID=28131 RepID=UPI001E63C0D2|nr:hypothetical protein [Prevotella intermedia]